MFGLGDYCHLGPDTISRYFPTQHGSQGKVPDDCPFCFVSNCFAVQFPCLWRVAKSRFGWETQGERSNCHDPSERKQRELPLASFPGSHVFTTFSLSNMFYQGFFRIASAPARLPQRRPSGVATDLTDGAGSEAVRWPRVFQVREVLFPWWFGQTGPARSCPKGRWS